MSKDTIINKSYSLLPYMTEIRRHLHQNPGVGFDNHETIEYIKEKLSEMSIESEYVGKCGLCAVIGCGEPCFLLRADTDGLCTEEETKLPFASKNGRMHSCGHDIHTSQLLGAAKILKENEDSLCGTVKLMFQSAEENLCGAVDMIENGILENPKPSAGMMLHVMTATDLGTGTLIIPTVGESAPAADFFEITVHGKGCHGSSPNSGKDPIYAACSIVTALSHINSRELAMSERAVITIGSINAGGAANVIPDSAVMKGSMRCFGKDLRVYLKNRLCEIAKNTAEVYGASAEIKFTSGCPSLVNNGELCSFLQSTLEEGIGKEWVKKASELGGGISGSEDFAYISERLPTVMIALCAGKRDDGYVYPLHHPSVDFDEGAMVNGCATLALCAQEFLRCKPLCD